MYNGYQTSTTEPTCETRVGVTILRFHTNSCNCSFTEIRISSSPAWSLPPLIPDEERISRQGLRLVAERPAYATERPSSRVTQRWREYARRRLSTKFDRAPPLLAAA